MNKNEIINYIRTTITGTMPSYISDLQISIELITPERADNYLQTMNRNRTLRQKRVNEYARDMVAGNFTFSIDPICFNTNGELINGQHRCQAVLKSMEPFWSIVLRNVPNDSVVDKGLIRNTSSALYMRGIIDKEQSMESYMSIARMYMRCKNNVYYNERLTDDQCGEFVNRYWDSVYKAYIISGKGKHHPICKKASVQAAIFAALECGVDESTLYRFAEVVNTGFPDNKYESAAIVLRNQIDEFKGGGGTELTVLTAISENAIKDFVTGNPRKQRYLKPTHFYINKCKATI